MQCDLSVLVIRFSHTQTSDCSHSSTADQQRIQLQSASHESVCLVPEWTSICLCLTAIFGQATTYVRASYSADIGITTATTSDVSSTCIVLALVAGRQDCQPYPNTVSQQQTLHICFSATVKSAVLLTIAVNMTCVVAFQCIERPNTNLLDCISDTVSSWIQAFHQALHISAFLGSVSEIPPSKDTPF